MKYDEWFDDVFGKDKSISERQKAFGEIAWKASYSFHDVYPKSRCIHLESRQGADYCRYDETQTYCYENGICPQKK